jgi:hypothetical protein
VRRVTSDGLALALSSNDSMLWAAFGDSPEAAQSFTGSAGGARVDADSGFIGSESGRFGRLPATPFLSVTT